MADATQAFAERNVPVTIQFVSGDTAIAALITGAVDLLETSPAAMIAANLNGQADLAFVAAGLNHNTIALYGIPSVATAAELKGKVVASDKPGTPLGFGVQVALPLAGLSPSEVSVLPIGTSDVVYTAMQAGQAQGGILAPPFNFLADSAGFHRIQDLYDVPYQNIGLVIPRARLAELAAAMPALLAGYRAGIQAFNDRPELAIQLLKDYTKEEDPAILQKTYDFYRHTVPFELSLQPNLAGFEAILQSLTETMPAASTAKPEQFVDTRFIAALPGS